MDASVVVVVEVVVVVDVVVDVVVGIGVVQAGVTLSNILGIASVVASRLNGKVTSSPIV